MIDVHSLLAAAERIRPLPTSVARLVAAATVDEPDFEDITQIVMSDPALTLLVLRAANSAYYGARRDISTVPQAMLRLGIATVSALGVGRGTMNLLDGAVPGYGLERGALWRQAVTAFVAAEGVRKVARVRVPADVATAALLHDVGKLILGPELTVPVRDLLLAAAQGRDRPGAERQLFGVHQAELGALITDLWQLPPSIVRAIQYQAAPDEYRNTLDWEERTLRVCQGVHLAIFLAEHADDPERSKGPLFGPADGKTRACADDLGATESALLAVSSTLIAARDERLGTFA